MLLKSWFFSSNISDEFTYILAFSLGYLRHTENELFVKSTRNKFQLYITLFTKILSYRITECKMYYVSLKKLNLENLIYFSLKKLYFIRK